MKKIIITIFFTFLVVFSLSTLKVNAKYVIDNKTLLDGSLEIEQVLEEEQTTVIEQMDNAIEIMSGNDSLVSIWNKATQMREDYHDNRPFLESNYYDNNAVLVDTYIFSALSVFWFLDWKLSFELLLQSYITKTDYSSYTPYYGYKMGNISRLNSYAHSSSTMGSDSFEWSDDLDLFFSIHGFNYTKPYASSTKINITDVYDFDTDNHFFEESSNFLTYPFIRLLNQLINVFGYYNSLGVLKPFTVNYTIEHSFSKEYTQWDEEYHKVSCSCGITYEEAHNFKRITNKMISESPNYVVNQYKCINCGFIKIEDDLII